MAPSRPLDHLVSYRPMPGGRNPEGGRPGPGGHMDHPKMCDAVKQRRERSPRRSGGAIEASPPNLLDGKDGVSVIEFRLRASRGKPGYFSLFFDFSPIIWSRTERTSFAWSASSGWDLSRCRTSRPG